jgi:hypothetical protein
MAVIGRTAHSIPATVRPRVSWGKKFDKAFDAFFVALTGWLCRASRGYLCPPDMPSIMYPDEPGDSYAGGPNSRASSQIRECCDEKLPGK